MKRLCLIALFCLSTTQAYATTKVQEVVSPGGIKAWLVEEHALPLVAVKLLFKDSGYAYDLPGKEGRASMDVSMLMEGADDMNAQAFNEALDNNAVQLGFSVDADYLHASMESLSENTEKAFTYLGLALTKPRYDEDALERVRSQTLSQLIQQEQQPGYRLQRGWQAAAFGKHPYANPADGTKDSVTGLNKDDLSGFNTHYLSKENMLIAVVGDITPGELSRLLDAYLGPLPAHYQPDVTLTDVALPEKASITVVKQDIPQTMVAFGVQGIKRNDPDYYAAYVMNGILGGNSLTDKLSTEIRQKRGLAYSVSSQLDPMGHAAIWGGHFATRNDEVPQAVSVLRDTLTSFVHDGPSEHDMSDVKKYLTGSFVLNLDSNSDIANFLIGMQLNKLGIDYLERRNQIINAVTTAQVKAIAQKIIDPTKLLVVMVGTPKQTISETPPDRVQH